MCPLDLEERVRLLEAGQIAADARLNELEGWRVRDEPRTLKLVQDAQIADEVRQALHDASVRGWSRLAKAGAFLVGSVTLAASTATLLHLAHVL